MPKKASTKPISPTQKEFEKEYIRGMKDLESKDVYIGNIYVTKSYFATIAPVIIVVILLCAIYLIFFA